MIENTTHAPNTTTYTNLRLACLTPEDSKRTYNYWYTITADISNHVGCRGREELTDWLDERGLTLTEALPAEQGTWATIRIEGSYHEVCHLYDVEAFKAIQPLFKIAEMSNGEYTLGKVTEADGVRSIHTLNVNVHERIVFPHADIRERKAYYQELINNSPDVEIAPVTSDDMFWLNLGYYRGK